MQRFWESERMAKQLMAACSAHDSVSSTRLRVGSATGIVSENRRVSQIFPQMSSQAGTPQTDSLQPQTWKVQISR